MWVHPSLVITLIYVSRMFTSHEFKDLTGAIPADFQQTEQQFWNYITQKLNPLIPRITCLFSSQPAQDSAESILINHLIKTGIQHVATPDDILLAEGLEWFRMKTVSPNEGILQLYEASAQEIQQHILASINNMLQNDELGVLLLSAGIRMTFPENFRVIHMLPFNPLDYLARHLTLKNLRTTNTINAN
jgi:hypothetical protein